MGASAHTPNSLPTARPSISPPATSFSSTTPSPVGRRFHQPPPPALPLPTSQSRFRRSAPTSQVPSPQPAGTARLLPPTLAPAPLPTSFTRLRTPQQPSPTASQPPTTASTSSAPPSHPPPHSTTCAYKSPPAIAPVQRSRSRVPPPAASPLPIPSTPRRLASLPLPSPACCPPRTPPSHSSPTPAPAVCCPPTRPRPPASEHSAMCISRGRPLRRSPVSCHRTIAPPSSAP